MFGRKVLLIDNNEEFLRLTCIVFQGNGAQVITARDGMEGIGKMLTDQPDLIILGMMMPREDSFRVYKKIRQFSDTPLIMLSVTDRAQLMQKGWAPNHEDFLTKPTSPEILLVRARTIMRHYEQNDRNRAAFYYNDGRLKIDAAKHRVLIRGERVKLTPVEFRLLVYLASNADKVLSFEQILSNVWGDSQRGNKGHVHVFISHLRNKIEDDTKSPHYIRSIRGVGYLFEKPDKVRSVENDMKVLSQE